MKYRWLHIFYLSVALCTAGWAHSDRVIRLSGTNLVGLPKRYSPATFDVDRKEIVIGTQRLTLAGPLKRFFPNDIPYKLEISASWYHDPNLLPPYLCLAILPEDRDFKYEILLNLDSLEVIYAHVLVRDSPFGWSKFSVETPRMDIRAYRESVRSKKPIQPPQPTQASGADLSG